MPWSIWHIKKVVKVVLHRKYTTAMIHPIYISFNEFVKEKQLRKVVCWRKYQYLISKCWIMLKKRKCDWFTWVLGRNYWKSNIITAFPYIQRNFSVSRPRMLRSCLQYYLSQDISTLCFQWCDAFLKSEMVVVYVVWRWYLLRPDDIHLESPQNTSKVFTRKKEKVAFLARHRQKNPFLILTDNWSFKARFEWSNGEKNNSILARFWNWDIVRIRSVSCSCKCHLNAFFCLLLPSPTASWQDAGYPCELCWKWNIFFSVRH